MSIQKWAFSSKFGVNLCAFIFVFFAFISIVNGDNGVGTTPSSCKPEVWNLKCDENKRICYDTKTAPNKKNKCKPTKRFNIFTGNGKEIEEKLYQELVPILKKDFQKHFFDGYFLKDYVRENFPEIIEILPEETQSPASLASGMTKPASGEQTTPPPHGTLTSMKCDFSDWENSAFVDVCDNNIYCHGRIIQAMNYHLFRDVFKNDSKYFVDSPLAKDMDADKVMAEFDQKFPNKTKIKDMNATELEKFYKTYFLPPNDTSVALEKCGNFEEEPEKLKEIKDETMRKWAMELHKRWGDLCRQIPFEAKDSNNRHSLIYVQNRFIVPGGRFREYYYWDSLWTIKGLLASGYDILAREMMWNFFDLVKKMNFVPNGGRIYYNMRSQPPLLIRMAWEYMVHAKEKGKLVLEQNINVLVKELEFWEQNRKVTVEKDGKKYLMYQYRTESQVPRPESFCVDVLTAMELKKKNGGNLSDERAGKLFQDLASAAESGWDFSSRWMANPDEPKLSEIITTRIVPVDLNAYICGNYRFLYKLFEILGNNGKAEAYKKKYEDFRANFTAVFLHGKGKSKTGWYDYNLNTKQNNVRFYGSMAVPLYMNCYDKNDQDLQERVYKTFAAYGAFDKGKGNGMPTSMKDSGQQWDLPNIWPPLVHMMIEGFRESKNEKMKEEAAKMAKEWIFANYKVYNKHCNHWNMWEKLTVNGEPGGGGEYEVQPGFGWTNGAILDLLVTYNNGEIEWGNRTLPPCLEANQTAAPSGRKSWSFHNYFKTLG